MAYRDFKDLTRWTAFDRIVRDKAFNIAENQKYVNSIKNGSSIKNENNILNKKSAEELHKQIIRRKYTHLIKDNIWSVDYADL